MISLKESDVRTLFYKLLSEIILINIVRFIYWNLNRVIAITQIRQDLGWEI